MAIQKQKLAADILEYVGGVDNVRDVAHCMTRLRIVVKDEKAVQMKQLEKLEGGYESRHSRGTISNSIRWYS